MESAPSNLLVFDPTAYPELFTAKRITLSWEYPTGTTITGLRAYQNSKLIGETSDPTARTLECIADITSGAVTYGVTAINPDGSETTVCNLLIYSSDRVPHPTQPHSRLLFPPARPTAPHRFRSDSTHPPPPRPSTTSIQMRAPTRLA